MSVSFTRPSPQQILIGILVLLTAGCYREDDVCICPPWSQYLEPTSPENLVANLETSYRRQEINRYVEILAPEFRFEFQSADAQEIGAGSWNRAPDSTCVDHLFRTPLVGDIRIELTHGPSEEPTEVGFDPGARRIRITPFLEVYQTDGIIWQVDGGVHDMFFRTGREAAGEDTTRWFLFEWREIPVVDAGLETPAPSSPRSATWADILMMYCDLPG